MTTRINAPAQRFTTLVLICCTTALCLTTAAHAANITAFGDSITAGHSSRSGGYPPKLSSQLNSNSKPSIVVNYGRSGEKTSEGVGRIDSVLRAFPANLILIMEGTNDVRSGISVETTKFNLQTMINKAKSAGATPVLSNLTPSDRGGSATLIPQTWNPMINALASSNGIRLADNYAAVAANWASLNADGIHPNDSGYQVIANTWFATISSMISSSGAVDEGGGGGGDDSSCFIATAAFGSPVEKQVMILREFRNACLLSNAPGRWLVKTYYHYSPAAADFIRQHDTARLIARVLLYPLVALAYLLVKLSAPVQLAIAVLGTVGCLALAAFAVRRRRQLTIPAAN
ncbi:MAG: GDSL-type esterase/lipase family protein [Desulforhopalus sp.]|nr:GDSL-type esterase/lipase family protein [Desulforhopalus sp.]